jgi:hypothetical protein
MHNTISTKCNIICSSRRACGFVDKGGEAEHGAPHARETVVLMMPLAEGLFQHPHPHTHNYEQDVNTPSVETVHNRESRTDLLHNRLKLSLEGRVVCRIGFDFSARMKNGAVVSAAEVLSDLHER